MSLLKSEAIMTLCFEMGYSDGDYSEEEIKSVCANPRFQATAGEFDWDLFSEKIKRGDANHANAVSALKGCSLDTQIDALAFVWHVLLADGVMTDEEKGVMARLLTEFDIDIETVSNRLKAQIA